MPDGSSSRWSTGGLLIGLAAGLAGVPSCSPGEDSQPEQAAPSPEQTAAPRFPDSLPEVRVDSGEGGRATRAIAEGCDADEASVQFEALVGERALAILSWADASERSADLEIPVYVVATEDGAIRVRFLEFPLREEYLHIWLGSGHIRPGPEDQFLIDPCSARLVPWPAGHTPADDAETTD